MDAVTASTIRRNGPARTVRTTTGTASTASGAWVTLISIAGRGVVFTVGGLTGGGGGGTNRWRVTIDGGTSMTLYDNPVTMYPRSSNMPFAYLNVPFESSLLVEFTQDSTSNSGTAVVTWGER